MIFKDASIESKAEAVLCAIMDALPQEMALLGADGVINAVNGAWDICREPLFEGVRRPGLGADWREALRSAASSGHAGAGLLLAGLEAIFAGEKEYFHLHDTLDPERQSSWFRLDARRLRMEPPAVLLSRSDEVAPQDFLQALRGSEQREKQRAAELQAILDTAPIGLSIALDARGERIRGNPALERMFGVPEGGELSMMSKDAPAFHISQGGRDVPTSALPMQRAVRGETVSNEILEIVGPDGRHIAALATAKPLYDEFGEPRGAVGAFLDVTKIKRAEDALRESEQRYRTLFEKMDEGYCIIEVLFGADGRACDYVFLETNPAFEAQSGLTGAAGRTIRDLLADIEQRWLDIYGEVARTGIANRFQEYSEAFGRHFDVFAYRLGAPGENRVAILFTDVTARRRSEDLLRESEFRLQLALDSGNIGIYEWRVDTGELIWDERLRAFWRLAPDARPSYDLFLEGVHPEDRARVQAEVDAALDPKKRARLALEYRVIPPGCDERWVFVTGNVFFDDGQAVRMVGAVQDITHRKQTENERQNFVSLAEQSVEFIGICDLSFRPIYVNPAGLRLAGLESFEAAARVRVQDFFFPEDQPFILHEFFPRVLREGHANVEIRFRRFDTGGALWMLYNVFYLRDASGAPIGLATVSRDINERRRAEDALRAADRRKDEFLATLAHELRNPLAPIRNAVHVLLHDAQSTHRSKRDLSLLSMIDRQAGHLVRLVDDLLEVSRITRGKIELRKQRVDLSDVLRHAVETAQPVIDKAGHELRVDLPAEPIPLHADPVRLTQVFTNLLNNAAKYTDHRGFIRLAAERRGDEAVVTLRDSGVGIPADMLPRVFDLFTQVDRSLGRSEGGLGIGLALVKSLLELHGGTVEAQSEGLGRGSVFEVRLPLSFQEGVEQKMTSNDQSPRSAHRILVIDDDHDVADSLVMFLETFGAEVRVAYSGEAGLEAVRDFRPELVFLDIGMPKMDGYETARRLRALPEGRDVKLVALTGWGQEQISNRAQDAGFDRQLTKPAGFDDLQALLDSLP